MEIKESEVYYRQIISQSIKDLRDGLPAYVYTKEQVGELLLAYPEASVVSYGWYFMVFIGGEKS